MKNDRQQVVGFRRVRGRVIPISGHIAGNAGLAAVGIGASSTYILKNAGKELKQAQMANKASVALRKRTFETYNIVKNARKAKLINGEEFLHQRNTIYKLLDQGKQHFVGRKRFTGLITKEIRSAARFQKLAIGLGAISLGALAYQKFSNRKK